MALSSELIEILRCSESKERLIYFPEGEGEDASGAEPFLFCPASKLRYSIGENDVPIMLVDEATRVDDDEAARLIAKARELGLEVPEDAA